MQARTGTCNNDSSECPNVLSWAPMCETNTIHVVCVNAWVGASVVVIKSIRGSNLVPPDSPTHFGVFQSRDGVHG